MQESGSRLAVPLDLAIRQLRLQAYSTSETLFLRGERRFILVCELPCQALFQPWPGRLGLVQLAMSFPVVAVNAGQECVIATTSCPSLPYGWLRP